MAKKKQEMWDLPSSDIQKQAEKSLEPKSPVTTTPKKPRVPKKTLGRPKVIEQPVKVVRIFESAKKLVRQLAAADDTTITEYLSDLIQKDFDKKFKK